MIDKIWMWVAWRLPKRLVYWATIRLMTHATVKEWSDESVTELNAMDALGRWDTEEGDS